MAVRTPVKLKQGFEYEIQEMTSNEIDLLAHRMCYVYGGNPSVNLSRVASAGTLNSMTDDRYQAGAFTTQAGTFVTEAATQDISLVAGTVYDNISQTVDTATGSYFNANLNPPTYYPLYWDATTGSLQTMTVQDMIDTFCSRAIDFLIAGNTTSDLYKKQGTYFISTATSVTGATLVDASPIFIDTTADASAYTSAGIPEVQDQPLTQNSYYLHRYNQVLPPVSYVPTVRIWPSLSDRNIIQHSESQIDQIFESFIREVTIGVAGYQLRYEIESPGTNGNIAGTSILNTRLNGTSAAGYTTRFISANDYRTQEFPNGTPVAAATYNLRISKS